MISGNCNPLSNPRWPMDKKVRALRDGINIVIVSARTVLVNQVYLNKLAKKVAGHSFGEGRDDS